MRALFLQYEKAIPHSLERQPLIHNISHTLEVHTAIEEELFYPTLRDPDSDLEMGANGLVPSGDHVLMHDNETWTNSTTGAKDPLDYGDEETFDGEEADEEDILVKADEDHGIVKALIEDLRHLPSNSHERHNILLVLREAIVNHMEEKEAQLIPVARINVDLSQLGIKMRAKQDLLRELKEI